MSTGNWLVPMGKNDVVAIYINESDYKDLREIQERENRDDIAAIMPILTQLFKDRHLVNVCYFCGHDKRDSCINDLPEI